VSGNVKKKTKKRRRKEKTTTHITRYSSKQFSKIATPATDPAPQVELRQRHLQQHSPSS